MKWWAWASFAASMIRGKEHGIAQADIHQHRVGKDEIGLEHGGDLGANRVER